MFLGIDVSTYLEQQRLSHPSYKKDGKIIDPFKVFKENGVTHIRTRIWNDPYDEFGNPYWGGTCDLNNLLELYEFLKDYGFKYVVDFHYSDFWADPGKQFLPKAWVNLTFEEMVNAIYDYTKESLMILKSHDIPVEFIQTGNEITHGMLWPHGGLDYNIDNTYEKFATLLKSARKACKEVYPEAKVIIHLEQSYDQDKYREIVNGLRRNGLEIDVIGSSYYPFWHRSFKEYFANMDMVQKELGIPVLNAELGYPFTLIDYKVDEKTGKPKHLVINAETKEEFLKMLPYPATPEGQAQFIKEFIALAKEHNLLASFYWEPLWIPGDDICWASDAGQKYQGTNAEDTLNEWANQCLFDYDGNALPSLDAFKMEK